MQTVTILLGVASLVLISVNLYNIIDRDNIAFVWGEVYSSNETEPVDVIIYIDGMEVRWCENLEPGEVFTFMWMSEFPFFERTKSVEIIAVSTGGSEPHTDSEFVSMKNLGSYSVKLYV